MASKFFEARLERNYSTGTLDMGRPYELERMTLAGCEARGYRRLSPGEFEKAKIGRIENGYAVMKTQHGEYRAVRMMD